MLETRKQDCKIQTEDDFKRLVGYACVFNEVADIGLGVKEKIAPGAFKRGIEANDILCLRDHNESQILGRTRAGTFRVKEDSKGLSYEVILPGTSLGRDTAILADRGDLGGVSVGFFIVRESWDGKTRTILEADLREISIISSFPAYKQTTIEATRKQHLAELKTYLRVADIVF